MSPTEIERLDTELALIATNVTRARLYLSMGDLVLARMEVDEIESEARGLKAELPEPDPA